MRLAELGQLSFVMQRAVVLGLEGRPPPPRPPPATGDSLLVCLPGTRPMGYFWASVQDFSPFLLASDGLSNCSPGTVDPVTCKFGRKTVPEIQKVTHTEDAPSNPRWAVGEDLQLSFLGVRTGPWGPESLWRLGALSTRQSPFPSTEATQTPKF